MSIFSVSFSSGVDFNGPIKCFGGGLVKRVHVDASIPSGLLLKVGERMLCLVFSDVNASPYSNFAARAERNMIAAAALIDIK